MSASSLSEYLTAQHWLKWGESAISRIWIPAASARKGRTVDGQGNRGADSVRLFAFRSLRL